MLKCVIIGIIRKDFFSCANIFISFFPELNYGGCSSTVRTCGCGPQNEGSIPSFRPFKKEVLK